MLAQQKTMACQACGAVLSREGKYPTAQAAFSCPCGAIHLEIPGAAAPVPMGSHQRIFRILFGAGKRQDTFLNSARCRSNL